MIARLALVLVLLIAALACGYFLARARTPAVRVGSAMPAMPMPTQAIPTAPMPTPPQAPPPQRPPLRPRRAAPTERPLPPASSGNEDLLVQGLIGVYDVSHDQAVQAHVTQVLQRGGFEKVVVPTGVVFDPASFEAVSTVATADPAKIKRVAQTIRPGWKGPTGLVRSAQVSVWVAQQGSDTDGTAK